MPIPQYDVIIVGGGPAGLSTAIHLLLARPDLAGRVLVLEKECYPRDKFCGGAIGRVALRRLARAGIVIDVPSISIDAVSFERGGQRRCLKQPGMGVLIRRAEFDHALARAAAAHGVEIREGAAVRRVESDREEARIVLASGVVISSRIVVGADGIASVVRRSLGFSHGRQAAHVVEVDTEMVDGDHVDGTIHFNFIYDGMRGYAWDFPTLVNGRRQVCRGVYRIVSDLNQTPRVPRSRDDDVTRQLARWLANKGLDLDHYRLKRLAERGFDPESAISAPRVILVGEAAGVDITTGEGIAHAIHYGSVAAPYLVGALEKNNFGFHDWLAHVRQQVNFIGWGTADPLGEE